MARLTGGLAVEADLLRLAGFTGHRAVLWTRIQRVTTDERYIVTRTIAATPAQIFAILSDPSRHKDTEPGDWVRDAIDTDPIIRTGQIFAINMFLERIGGPYVMHNLVTAFEQDRAISWAPGRLDDAATTNPAAGRGATTWCRTEQAPTSPSPTTGARHRRS